MFLLSPRRVLQSHLLSSLPDELAIPVPPGFAACALSECKIDSALSRIKVEPGSPREGDWNILHAAYVNNATQRKQWVLSCCDLHIFSGSLACRSLLSIRALMSLGDPFWFMPFSFLNRFSLSAAAACVLWRLHNAGFARVWDPCFVLPAGVLFWRLRHWRCVAMRRRCKIA